MSRPRRAALWDAWASLWALLWALLAWSMPPGMPAWVPVGFIVLCLMSVAVVPAGHAVLRGHDDDGQAAQLTPVQHADSRGYDIWQRAAK